MAAPAARLRGLALALALLMAGARPGPVAAQQVITADQIRAAGVMRLGELLTLAERWDVTTTEGMTWQVSPRGLAPLEAGRWRVLVDGQPVDLDLFGTTNLDRLPVPLQAIDSVELVDAPRLAAGELTRGLLHIHTRRPRPGPSAQAWYTTGSEIGDPGPFAFTPRAGANVDRFGHDGSVALSYGGRRWWAETSVGDMTQIPTDPAIQRRYVAGAAGQLVRIEGPASAVRLGAEVGGRAQELVFRYSRLSDYFAPKPLGRPVLTTERFAHLGFTGAAALDGARDLRYYLTRSVNRSETGGAVEPAFAWRAVTLTAGVEAVRADAAVLRTVGVRFRRVRADAPGLLGEGTLTLGSAYGELLLDVAEGFAPNVAAMVTLAADEIGVAAALGQHWNIAPRYQLGLDLSYTRRTRAEDNSLWAWAERGYAFLEDAGLEVEIDGALRRPGEVAADVSVGADLPSGVHVRLGGEWRSFVGLALARQRLRFVREPEAFEGPTRLLTGAHGQVAGLEATLTARPERQVRTALTYRLRGTIAGSDAFRDAWATIPRHVARATAEYAPVPSFSIWASLTYRGPSRWAEYRDVEIESAGQYRSTIPAAFVADVAIQKWFWEKRLRANLGLRNVTDAPLRYHPAGATWAPAFAIQIEARAP